MAILVQRASHSSILKVQDHNASDTVLYSISNHIENGARPLPVGGQNYSSSLFGNTEDAVPQKPFGFGIHTSGWLILQHDGSVSNISALKHHLKQDNQFQFSPRI